MADTTESTPKLKKFAGIEVPPELTRTHYFFLYFNAFLIGMTTYDGEVTAAPDWGRPAHRWRVRPALPGSHEELLHGVGPRRYWLATADAGVRAALTGPRLERAIGVVYRPVHERQSHYVLSNLAERFDAVIHLDRTSALEPLDRSALWDTGEPPETYPSGL